ncbi:MAG: hypothetical protein ABIF08_01585 [Nanoarchaeota archaeon]
MGGAPNYNRFKSYICSVRTKNLKNREQRVEVSSGKGRYPKCLQDKPYEICPNETPKNPKDIPKECKSCPQYTESSFDTERRHQEKLKRLRESGMPTQIIS